MAGRVTDLLVTWPKSRPLASYLVELELAKRDGLQINFRVPSQPREFLVNRRCYRVHDGKVRGWVKILGVSKRGPNEVARVKSDAFAGFWPPGWYVVCDPAWHELPKAQQQSFPGFRGFHYIDRSTLEG